MKILNKNKEIIMSKSKTMAFADFLERISTDEGKAKLDALIAQKILGKKVIARSGKFYREEPASEQHPKGGVYANKKYTNSIEAAEDLIDHVTSTGHVVIARINNNHVMFNGEKVKPLNKGLIFLLLNLFKGLGVAGYML